LQASLNYRLFSDNMEKSRSSLDIAKILKIMSNKIVRTICWFTQKPSDKRGQVLFLSSGCIII
jgi:hypothetical protein